MNLESLAQSLNARKPGSSSELSVKSIRSHRRFLLFVLLLVPPAVLAVLGMSMFRTASMRNRSISYYETLVENLGSPLIVLDRYGNMALANQAARTLFLQDTVAVEASKELDGSPFCNGTDVFLDFAGIPDNQDKKVSAVGVDAKGNAIDLTVTVHRAKAPDGSPLYLLAIQKADKSIEVTATGRTTLPNPFNSKEEPTFRWAIEEKSVDQFNDIFKPSDF